jgi:hypothetical protein
VPSFISQLIVRTQLDRGPIFRCFSCLCVLDLPGYLSRARLFVMTRTSKSS